MKEFFKAFFSKKVGLNFLAIILVLIGLVIATYISLGYYTNHGEKVDVPNVKKKTFKAAKHDLAELGLEIEVTDTLYLKNLPADIVLEQMPAPGKTVKPGRVIYVVINAGHSPIRAVPEIVDNSSAREAKAKLNALGFNRVEIQYVPGEKDWVYGLKCDGKEVANGEQLSVDSRLILIVGDGERDLNDSIISVPSNFVLDRGWETAGYSGYSGGGGAGATDNDGSASTYTDEQVEQEVEANVDAAIESAIRERHSQKYEGGTE